MLNDEGHSVGALGPVLCDKKGYVLSNTYVNNEMHEVLEKIQMERRDLLPADAEIVEIYKVNRSFRRGANELKYSQNVGDFNHHWRTMQNPREMANLPMGQLYLDILRRCILTFTFPSLFKYYQASYENATPVICMDQETRKLLLV